MYAFERLVKEFGRPLHAFAFHITCDREVAKDMVQDVFATLWANRKKIDFAESIGGYLYRHTRNASLNYLRRASRTRGELHAALPADDLADLFMLEEEFERLLGSALDRLPARTAEVIRLSLCGLPQKQIAERMNVTVSNVKNLKSAGLRRLRELLGPYVVFLLFRMLD